MQYSRSESRKVPGTKCTSLWSTPTTIKKTIDGQERESCWSRQVLTPRQEWIDIYKSRNRQAPASIFSKEICKEESPREDLILIIYLTR